jgi:hypothetical protein
MIKKSHILLTSIIMVGVGAKGFGGENSVPTYWQHIRPILRKHCTVCHSAKNLRELDVSGGLALDTFDAIKKGSTRQIFIRGKAEQSLLYELITTPDVKRRMPLEAKPLPGETIALLKRWIETGAKEGTPAENAPEPIVAKKSTTARKLDVIFPTTATPPAGLFGKTPPGNLELALKIGPLSPVAAVAFSPDEKLLAAGSYGQVTIWDLTTAKPAKILTNVLGAVHDVRFNLPGTLLAVAGGQPSGKGEVRLFQTSDWKLLAVLRGHDDVVFSVAFSPKGDRLATASFDHTVCLWDVASHGKLKTYSGHSDFVYAVAFSPDGKKLASAGKDRVVCLIDVENGKSLFTFSGMENDIMTVAFSPDGKRVVSSGFEPALYWWNPVTGEQVKAMGGHGVAVHELAFSKDGKRVVSGGADRTIRVWDGNTMAALRNTSINSIVYAVAFSPSGKLIASGAHDGLVRLHDEADLRHLATLVAKAGEEPEWLAITPAGYTVAGEDYVKLGRWRIKGQEIDANAVWMSVRQADPVIQGMRGEKIAPVKFQPRP